MMKKLYDFLSNSVREVVFGLEDSLVSTLGAVTGIAIGSQSEYVVILSGIVLIFAEATSMAAGSYLSSKSAIGVEAVELKKKNKTHEQHAVEPVPLQAGIVMGVFYFLGGSFPLFPYFILPVVDAIIPSVVITGIMLFVLGVGVSKLTKRSPWKSGAEMVAVSLFAAGLGYVVGRIVAASFGVDAPV